MSASLSLSRSNSEAVIDEQEKRTNEEVDQLLLDIRRIGPTYPPPSPKCLFGELFDDEGVEQYYEALVGTLKCAKKRGKIRFKGQMLLKGMHDKVVVTIVEEGVPEEEEPEEQRPVRLVTPKAAPKSFSYKKAQILKKQKSPIKKSPIREKKKSEIDGTFSDSEAGAAAALQEENRNRLNINISVASDSEADPGLKSPRRLMIPSIFRSASARHGLPPAGAPSSWRLRSSMMMKAATRKPLVLKRWSEQPKPEKEPVPQAKKTNKPKLKPLARTMSVPVVAASSTPRNHSGEAASRMEEEVQRLLIDIRRIGDNPGEPTVKFGELFDDDEVQNTYEALVGTLRSAKRQGLIDFKGQMLLKGMHDQVVISVVESN
mmetsp:Transcript_9308/g.15470  ORF Transcript_9308/g.15470 Transcript_9308/m.15470 type:complete len:374 (+) Transcript_9308:149-1270(+)|eukprot:CAMPEP_0119018622 /NCGR_PEP_ID=MMETSP1176-20130426/19885_1 /TAXON_ID=265551 /ORGANISM="Synedropsis recta cf, Strain CCMP1620" /LENGTH=373 /DNA_ID=CAMNT_0006972657 /DNA_START=106 /DNA_END=1227 /DNA_ORIENTATION=+